MPSPHFRVVSLPRGAGKTTTLVEYVRRTTGGVLLCPTENHARAARQRHALRAEQVITPGDLMHMRGMDVTLFVDDAELVLHWFLNNQTIGAMAFTTPPATTPAITERLSDEMMDEMRMRIEQQFTPMYVESRDTVVRFDMAPGPGTTVRMDGISMGGASARIPQPRRARPQPPTGDLRSDDPTEN